MGTVNLSKKIADILKKEKVKVQKLSKKTEEKDEPLSTFNELLPDNVFIYDGKCINDKDDYETLLLSYAACTEGEFQPKNINIGGEREKTIEVSFSTDSGNDYKFKIKQNGSRWVDESFTKKINAFCKKNYSGLFYDISNEDLAAVVYLPKKAVSKLEKALYSIKDTDALVEYVIACEAVVDPLVWSRVPWDIFYGYTKDGESFGTALLKAVLPKSKLKKYAPLKLEANPIDADVKYKSMLFEYLSNFNSINFFLQNKKGESLQKLANDLYNNENGELLYSTIKCYNLGEEKDYSYFLEHQSEDRQFAVYRLMPELLDIFRRVEHKLTNMVFSVHCAQTGLCFTYKDKFSFENESFNIFLNFDGDNNAIGYEVFSQKTGVIGATLLKLFTLDQKDDLIELITKYCDQKLWD